MTGDEARFDDRMRKIVTHEPVLEKGMTLLAAMRWTLVVSIIVYASAFVIGGELGLLVGIIGAYAMPICALGCVIIQIVALAARKREPVEKPE